MKGRSRTHIFPIKGGAIGSCGLHFPQGTEGGGPSKDEALIHENIDDFFSESEKENGYNLLSLSRDPYIYTICISVYISI